MYGHASSIFEACLHQTSVCFKHACKQCINDQCVGTVVREIVENARASRNERTNSNLRRTASYAVVSRANARCPSVALSKPLTGGALCIYIAIGACLRKTKPGSNKGRVYQHGGLCRK